MLTQNKNKVNYIEHNEGAERRMPKRKCIWPWGRHSRYFISSNKGCTQSKKVLGKVFPLLKSPSITKKRQCRPMAAQSKHSLVISLPRYVILEYKHFRRWNLGNTFRDSNNGFQMQWYLRKRRFLSLIVIYTVWIVLSNSKAKTFYVNRFPENR